MHPERRALSLLLTGVVLIGAAGLTAWFFANFERKTLEVPAGASAEARRNPFLAAERFLARLGIPVESRAGRDLLRQFPPTSDTLVLNGLGPLNAERREALRAWIEGGGRLVVEAKEIREDGDQPDDLLGTLGVRLKSVEPEDSDCTSEVLAELFADEGHPPLEVAFSSCRALELGDREGTKVGAKGHTRLALVPIGEGQLTVLSDSAFMTNSGIGKRDHALVLAHLAEPAPGGKVWLLYDSSVPWLGALLWAAAPGALLGAALLIPVWLWSLGARLGPLEPPPDRRRRDLAEHLVANGTFLWRQGLASRLVEPTRKRVLAAWQRRRPELRLMGPQQQARAIAKATGLPPDTLAEALLALRDEPLAFVEQAHRLQWLWHGARPSRQARQPATKTRG